MPRGQNRGRGLGRGRGMRRRMSGSLFRQRTPIGRSAENNIQHNGFVQPDTSMSKQDELAMLNEQANSIKKQLGIIDDQTKKVNNTDDVAQNTKAFIHEAECIGCARCVSACPQSAIYMNTDIAKINLEKCTGCGFCVSECPQHAISLKQI